jgi:hypothetical protein
MHFSPADSSSKRIPRAWYSSSIADFLAIDPDTIIGRLTSHSDFEVVREQTEAWLAQVALLKEQLASFTGFVLLEFNIPRMGRRIDAVVISGPAVFVIEFKVASPDFDRAAIDQVWDYALDVKNFHEASHDVSIVPILVATAAESSRQFQLSFAPDLVAQPICIHPAALRLTLDRLLREITGESIDTQRWVAASYRPTPTIVEAARALYAKHSVESITRNDAGAVNLSVTWRRVEDLVDEARAQKRKIICFVTGVPGAGKTLVGLNLATRRSEAGDTHAVFLSGNGPLVAVLREALTRDELARRVRSGEKTTKKKAANPVKAFIQNVHHFRDEALRDVGPPIDHVAIFDEAQRAWNIRKTASFMKQKKGQPNFKFSEPAFLIHYMDRHTDWAAIICLVGGGQEINDGEAGIGEWLAAVKAHYPHWHLFISDQLADSEYAAGRILDSIQELNNVHLEENLHLAVSMRSFRAENVSAFVKATLDCEVEGARKAFSALSEKYPIVLTRDLSRAKQWIRARARGGERFGLVASSKAMRLKPHAIDIRVSVDPVHWFLSGRDDTRSSYYLEDCATEFQVQGLELDWTCVNWDADLRFGGSSWNYHDFRGSKWQNVNDRERRNYLRNAYRVLLTRARQGMVLFVPPGDPADPTRHPEFYDSTFNYLQKIGLPVLD